MQLPLKSKMTVYQQNAHPANLDRERLQAVCHPNQQPTSTTALPWATQHGGTLSAAVLLPVLEAEGSNTSFGDEAERELMSSKDR